MGGRGHEVGHKIFLDLGVRGSDSDTDSDKFKKLRHGLRLVPTLIHTIILSNPYDLAQKVLIRPYDRMVFFDS